MSFDFEKQICVPSISTARLELVAVTPESVLSEQVGDGRLGEILGCRVTAEWPPADWEPHVLEWLLKKFEEDPKSVGWGRYVLLREDEALPVLIGTVGAFHPTEDPRSSEIGYGILPEFRLRGYALEATLALIAWIEATGEVDRIIAHTYPELAGSIRIMERCGLVFEGPGVEERTIRYGRRVSSP
jgi:[ribosomal protein S5]-alanine N-acetyltransferase